MTCAAKSTSVQPVNVIATMADAKLPTRRPSLPAILREIGMPGDRPVGKHWLGFQRSVIARNTRVVAADVDYLDARRRQADAYLALIEARLRVAQKIAELIDLPNRLHDDQRQREHARHLAEQKRALERLQADYDRRIATARNEAELARVQETGVRASRNFEAARRVKESEIDRWYAEAEARRNNAEADRQDTAADLVRDHPQTPDAATGRGVQRAADLAVLDHQIELERQRGNEAAVLALMNLRARLQGASS